MSSKLYNRVNRDILKLRIQEDSTLRVTLSFYKYIHITNVDFFRDHLYTRLDRLQTLGRIYVAKEGINAQISIPQSNFSSLRSELENINFLKDVRLNKAIEDDGMSFYKLKIKIRDKIVADGIDDATFDSSDRGKHLDARSFNQLAELEQSIIVDMRNHYESEIGHFQSAICPDVETFKESLTVVEKMLEAHKDQPILMYCTGGIRCEKASAYLRHKGFSDVYQLDGGIIEYSRESKNKGLENKFKGKNFVFDDRLGERISPEIISRCHQCGDLSDQHVNCANDACHILFIQCGQCGEEYDHCCSVKCSDFIKLPEQQREALKKSSSAKLEFNGTKFGKGRYKAHQRNEKLNI